jgi:hypothetical protein
MPDAQENLYANLKTLIWGAFIGIVSFQILGPNLAIAIHNQVGCSEQTAYDLFSRLYLLLPPAISLFLIIRDFHLFKKYLSPFGEDKIDRPSKWLLFGVVVLWSEQFATTYCFLTCEGPYAPFALYLVKTILESALCLVLMICGFGIAIRKFRRARHTNRSDKGYLFQLGLTCFLLFLFLTFFLWSYIYQNGHRVFLRDDKYNQGFTLLQEKDSLQDGLRQIAHVIEGIRLQSQTDSLKKGPESLSMILVDTSRPKRIFYSRPRVKYDSTFTRTIDTLNVVALRLAATDDRLYHLLRDVEEITDTLAEKPVHLPNEKPDSSLLIIGVQHQDDTTICGLAVRELDTLWHREKRLPDTMMVLPNTLDQKARDSDIAILNSNYGNYLRQLQVVTNHLATNIDDNTKKEIGNQLRYTQLIGTPVLVGLFFSLLSLYIFLKMNSRLTDKELTQQKMMKRRLTATGSHNPERENLDIVKEQEAEESSGLTNNTWLLITIVVWLLVGFFKPIDDDKIDLADPFKTLTFSDPGNPLNPKQDPSEKSGGYKYDTTITVTNYFKDSVKVVPYVKDSLVNRRIFQHDTIFRYIKLDTANFDAQFDEINKRLDYLVPPRKSNTGKQ